MSSLTPTSTMTTTATRTTSYSSSTSLLVIGAGLPRTGTKSMKKALEIIYSKPCYHGIEIITKRRSDVDKWFKLLNETNKTLNEMMIHKMLYEILNGYIGEIDIPACGFYRQLMTLYPEAKVILTVRDRNDWLTSLRQVVLPKSNDPLKHEIDTIKQMLRIHYDLNQLIMDSLKFAFCKDDIDFDNDEVLLQCFDEYIHTVQEIVPSERLLIHKLGDGWESLCNFLNVNIPIGIDYPHVNYRYQMKELMELVKNNGSFEKVAQLYPELI